MKVVIYRDSANIRSIKTRLFSTLMIATAGLALEDIGLNTLSRQLISTETLRAFQFGASNAGRSRSFQRSGRWGQAIQQRVWPSHSAGMA